MIGEDLAAGVVAMRTFLPAKDFQQSLAFYDALGFTIAPLGDKLASLHLGQEDGAPAFLLQDFYLAELANNAMMHLLVSDLGAWWAHIDSLDLAARFGVRRPREPKLEPWGLEVAYVWDPAGVLWHIAAVP